MTGLASGSGAGSNGHPCTLHCLTTSYLRRCCDHAVQAFAVTPDVRTAMETAEPFSLHGAVTRLQILALLKHRVRLYGHEQHVDVESADAQRPRLPLL
jgi:hypothetical protein